MGAMAVGEGKFVLYSRIEPPLEAGDYRFTASQGLSATGLSQAQLPVAPLLAHVTVRSPRYILPPDQVLSTFPPAGSEGAYGARLPQVVIRRRTLPWERLVQAGVPRSTPWLALVLIAEGEAELKMNEPVANCVSPGVTLPGKAEVELGNYLKIRKSVVDQIFPTRLDVPLLAHAREVDIHDTELMMGDDDGFLAVVIGNRLPLPGRDPDGTPVPVKYLACLVNLEGQFTSLLEKSPAPASSTSIPLKISDVKADQARWDHTKMGRPAGTGALQKGTGKIVPVPSAAPAAAPAHEQAGWPGSGKHGSAEVYTEMAQDFSYAVVGGFVAGQEVVVDPTLHFPVLLHWSFTSYGSTTFRSLVEGLDSGLLGTIGEDAQPVEGRLPEEVVETGHTGLAHRTRRGDVVRSWYRGPLVPHPTTDPPGGRLPLAHAADQLRIVVPDGREDISLAAAFEIGRLLALARPSMVAALMRWRQGGYQTARREAVWSDLVPVVKAVAGAKVDLATEERLGVLLGRGLAVAAVARPADFVGDPLPLVSGGRALAVDGATETLLAKGYGLAPEVFKGDAVTVLGRLRDSAVLRPEAVLRADGQQVRAVLAERLGTEVTLLAQDALAITLGGAAAPDVLDRLIDGMRAGPEEER